MRSIGIIASISLLVSIFVAWVYIPRAIVIWDEATHMNTAYTMYTYLSQGSIGSYLTYAVNQTGYPPLMPIVSSLIFLVTGFSIEIARGVNLMWLVVSSILLYLLGKKMGRARSGESIGMVSSLLFVSSPLILLLHMMFMREGISMTMTLFAVLIYFIARDRDTWRWYVFAGVALFAPLMAKYNFGIIVGFGFFLEFLISWIFFKKERKHLFQTQGLLFGATAILFIAWMSYPSYKIPGLLRAVFDPIEYSVGGTFWQYLFYYPMAILYTYSASVVIGIGLFLGYLASLGLLNDYKVRTLWLICTINLILGIIHFNNVQERYIATGIPFLFLITSYSFVHLLKKIPWKNKMLRNFYGIIALVLIVKIFIDLVGLPSYIYTLSTHAFRTALFNQLAYEETLFVYDTATWKMPLGPKSSQKPQDVVDFVVENIDVTKPVWIDGYSNELSPGYFDMMFSLAKRKNIYHPSSFASYTVTVEVLPESRYYTYDYRRQNMWQIPNVRARQTDPMLTKITQKKFDELGIEVVVYAN